MKIRIGVFCLLSGITLSAAVFFPSGLYGEDKVYLVRKGETFYSIARAFGIDAGDLMKHNGVSDPTSLRAGQRLKIPDLPGGNTAAVSGAGQSILYRVARGDTFYGIARKYSVDVDIIMEANSLSPGYMLREGDTLNIPVNGGGAQAGRGPPPERSNPAPAANAPVKPAAGIAPVPGTPSGASAPAAIDPSVRWPVSARELSYMTGKLSGVAITGRDSESVQSLTGGIVLSAGPFQGFGKVVIIQVDGGYLYVYGGCESLSVKEGDKVSPGTELGKLGIDGVSNKPLLFFMVYRSNSPVDPAKAPRA